MDRYSSVLGDDFKWPSGHSRPACTIAVTPEEFSGRAGLQFHEGLDDLDYHRRAAVRLPSGRPIVLMWYERAPVMEMILEVDFNDDIVAARNEALSAFGIDASEVTWTPEIDAAAS